MNQTTTPPRIRWECNCDPTESPILLGRYEPGRHVEIKVGDRYYLASLSTSST